MKKILRILAILLIGGALFILFTTDVPCEENPKMVMNGYCETNGGTK